MNSSWNDCGEVLSLGGDGCKNKAKPALSGHPGKCVFLYIHTHTTYYILQQLSAIATLDSVMKISYQNFDRIGVRKLIN